MDQGWDQAFADAAAMARSNVSVIVASGSELPLQAAVAATSTIPIVILANNYDPIARGYVANLARPAATSPDCSLVSRSSDKNASSC